MKLTGTKGARKLGDSGLVSELWDRGGSVPKAVINENIFQILSFAIVLLHLLHHLLAILLFLLIPVLLCAGVVLVIIYMF